MASVTVAPEFVGVNGTTNVYRIDLSQVGLANIQSITLQDDGLRSGATRASSGSDIDFVKIAQERETEAWKVVKDEFGSSDQFDYQTGVVFNAGYLTSWSSYDNPLFDVGSLFGTSAGAYDPGKATFRYADAEANASIGTLSLGEGGQLTFLLNGPATGYLYVGEDEVVDGLRVVLSDEKAAPLFTGITIAGDDLPDTILLGRGDNAHVGAGNDIISGLGGNDTIMSAGGADKLYGGYDDDSLYGEAGNDTLFGDYGNDKLYGGAGNDKLYGQSGRDVFVFDSKLGTASTDRRVNFDKILDFKVKDDSVWLDNAIFKKLGSGSELNPKQLKKTYFEVGSKADDSNDYIIYNKKTGVLSYDSDGSGKNKAIEIAQLSKNLAMTYKDFFVI
jgi:Ca2+-binding RTX toxin-like protein